MRDWGYAPEYVKVMWQMLNVEKPGDYVICTGEAHTLQEFIDKVFINLDLDPKKYVQFDEKLYRPVELEIIFGNNTKAKTQLGWEYNMTFDELIKRLIEDEIFYQRWWNEKRNN